MLYREIIAVCSEIHTKHINTAVWAERRIFSCVCKIAEKRRSFFMSVCLSVQLQQLVSHWMDFHENSCFFLICRRNQVWFKSANSKWQRTADRCAFLIASRWRLLRMRNVSDKNCSANQTHVLCSNFIFENPSFYNIMCKNVVHLETR